MTFAPTDAVVAVPVPPGTGIAPNFTPGIDKSPQTPGKIVRYRPQIAFSYHLSGARVTAPAVATLIGTYEGAHAGSLKIEFVRKHDSYLRGWLIPEGQETAYYADGVVGAIGFDLTFHRSDNLHIDGVPRITLYAEQREGDVFSGRWITSVKDPTVLWGSRDIIGKWSGQLVDCTAQGRLVLINEDPLC